MDMRPALQLKSAIKAMTDVVMPAVDPGNKLAQEQAQLVVGMLSILLHRLPLAYRYELDELARSLTLGENLLQAAKSLKIPTSAEDAITGIAHAILMGRDVQERARAEPAELEAANFNLRSAVGAFISTVSEVTPAHDFKNVTGLVMQNARDQLLRERAWLVMQGWEPNAKSIPAIEALIGAPSSNGVSA